ncbi:DeoR/GlpR family DNA-binding transcription regulator [Microbacterium maritypicum]|uniref:Lactose phosphotransferase system repressor n=1 Tax=Microbacterium maritypicum TaxID=33918 RepID=A0AAJ5VB44_MICMQ|nr:DeoR/GlpR family DNA-binding transcription regulator [Microbacterium liquefaciens]MBP5803631.1 DeoR/GlpR transcriptional regulator [Microbacterium liquefaciens]WEF21002.1 DeoR/GlpR family DNA-binding transcription regulator [Microbacterium liquefaciens]
MLAAQRKDHLLDLLARDGRVVAKTAADEVGVSEDAIRRDLRELAEEGKLQRVYGGALPIPAREAPVSERTELATASKERVARAAVATIRPDSTIILDAGTTTLAMARILPSGTGLTVITASPAVALAAAEHSDARVIVVGGELSRHSLVTGGGMAMEAIQHVAADTFFLGATGIDPARGLTTGELEDAVTKRALASRCTETVVLASEEKIGAVARYPILALDAVTAIITDPADDNPLTAEVRSRIDGQE